MRNLLHGRNIIINSISEPDLERIHKWFNNVSFLRYYDMLPAIPQNGKQVAKAIEDFVNSDRSMMLAIRLKESNQIIGVIGLFDIQWTNGTATFFIGIGEDGYTGKGYGSEAIELMLDFGFHELNLYRIQLNVIAYNTAAINAYEKVGFIREGCFRELVFREGKRHDLYLYGLLRDEWKNGGYHG